MAFIATNILPAVQYDRAKTLASQAKLQADNRAASFASGATSAEVLATLANIKAFYDQLLVIRDVPGIAQYAKDQENDQSYDFVTELNVLLSAMVDVRDTILGAIPKDGNDWLLERKLNADGSYTYRTYTGAALAPLIADLQAVSAAVS